MGITGYISEIKNAKIKPVELGSVGYEFLLNFAYSDFTVWDIFKKYENITSTSYKNTHKTIQKLSTLKLIQRIDQKRRRNQRGKIYYRITINGMIYILTHRWFHDYSQFLLKHKDDVIFQTLIFNNFEFETMHIIPSYWFHFELYSYISDCLNYTLEVIDKIRIYPDHSNIKIIDSDSNYYLENLENYLQKRSLSMTFNLIETAKRLSTNKNIDSLSLNYLLQDKKFKILLKETKKIILSI